MTPAISCELAHRMMPGKRSALMKDRPMGAIMVAHPFRVIKRQFGYVQVKCCGLEKHDQPNGVVCAIQHLIGAQTTKG